MYEGLSPNNQLDSDIKCNLLSLVEELVPEDLR